MSVPVATDWLELLVAPLWSIVVLILALAIAWWLRRPLLRVLNDLGVSRLSFLGIDIEWIAGQTRDAYSERDLTPPESNQLRAFALLSIRLAPLARNRRILWVDDQPNGNATETRLLRRLGVDIENATSTSEALEQLQRGPGRFDLVISDWDRGNKNDGIELVSGMRAADITLPVVMYVGLITEERRVEAARHDIAGLTSMPDDLLKRVLVELATAE